ncbi:MAG: hypothetical protein IJV22_00645 [Bacteroidales bacterium]|nr:hypothetical protein [Bacteroidales bacterium]
MTKSGNPKDNTMAECPTAASTGTRQARFTQCEGRKKGTGIPIENKP